MPDPVNNDARSFNSEVPTLEKAALEKGRLTEAFKSLGVVPDILDEVPKAPVTVTIEGKTLQPGEQTYTSALDTMPDFYWETEPGALYTMLIEDNNPGCCPGSQFGDLFTVNIPGTDVKSGDDVLSYVPSFSFELNEARDKLDVETLTKKPHLVLIYKQKEIIEIDALTEGHINCNETLTNRFNFPHKAVQEKYDLELVAGFVYTVTYEPGWSEFWLCHGSTGAGVSVPFLIEGVNDFPKGECELCKKPSTRNRQSYNYNQHKSFFHMKGWWYLPSLYDIGYVW